MKNFVLFFLHSEREQTTTRECEMKRKIKIENVLNANCTLSSDNEEFWSRVPPKIDYSVRSQSFPISPQPAADTHSHTLCSSSLSTFGPADVRLLCCLLAWGGGVKSSTNTIYDSALCSTKETISRNFERLLIHNKPQIFRKCPHILYDEILSAPHSSQQPLSNFSVVVTVDSRTGLCTAIMELSHRFDLIKK